MFFFFFFCCSVFFASVAFAQPKVAFSQCFDAVEVAFILVETINETNYEDARKSCENVNSSSVLAILNNEEKLELSRNFVKDNEIFIRADEEDPIIDNFFFGLQKGSSNENGVDPIGFLWEDGTLIEANGFAALPNIAPWKNGEPNSANGEKCIELRGDNLTFNDRDCDQMSDVGTGLLCEVPCLKTDTDLAYDSTSGVLALEVILIFTVSGVFGLVFLLLLISLNHERQKLDNLKDSLEECLKPIEDS